MTFRCTTVSTSAWAITRAMIGLRMSARTNSAPPMSCRRRDDVDPDDPVDAGLGDQQRGEAAAQVAGDPGDEHDPPGPPAGGPAAVHGA